MVNASRAIKALAFASIAAGAFSFTVSHLNAKGKPVPQVDQVTYADVMQLATSHPDGGRLIEFIPDLPIYCEADFDCTKKAAAFGCLEIAAGPSYGFVCHGPTYRHQLSRHSA